jgi:hypothetical protein
MGVWLRLNDACSHNTGSVSGGSAARTNQRFMFTPIRPFLLLCCKYSLELYIYIRDRSDGLEMMLNGTQALTIK